VARTALLFRMGDAQPGARAATRVLIALLRNLFFVTYINRYINSRPNARAQIRAWQLPVAIARLDENIVQEHAKPIAMIEQLARADSGDEQSV